MGSVRGLLNALPENAVILLLLELGARESCEAEIVRSRDVSSSGAKMPDTRDEEEFPEGGNPPGLTSDFVGNMVEEAAVSADERRLAPPYETAQFGTGRISRIG